MTSGGSDQFFRDRLAVRPDGSAEAVLNLRRNEAPPAATAASGSAACATSVWGRLIENDKIKPPSHWLVVVDGHQVVQLSGYRPQS